MPGAVVVMGVSGCGKSTLCAALAQTLGWRAVDGDGLHPPGNIAKMAAGAPLDDLDRRPFLENVAAALAAGRRAGVVAACSALKRDYRDLIRARAGEVLFVLPALDRDALLERLTRRTGHFMPASLLDSQLADLEPPGADEAAVVLDAALPVAAQVLKVRTALLTTA